MPGFDFAFQWGDRRLLVEVTTPVAPSADCYNIEEMGGHTHYSGDERTLDATLLRLTTAFSSKAKLIAQRLGRDESIGGDYKVIAISGFEIGQNMPFPPSATGPVPDFIRAFLPIGSMFARFPVGPGTEDLPLETGYHLSETIPKGQGKYVNRTAFVEDNFRHIDAIAYTQLNLLGLAAPARQVGVLHNPCAVNANSAPSLGMGDEYRVTLREETFELEWDASQAG